MAPEDATNPAQNPSAESQSPIPGDPPPSEPVQDAGEMAEQALADAQTAAQELEGVADGRNVELPNFQKVLADVEASGLELIQDVDLHVKIELGRTSMYVEDVLRLSEGSVVELDKLAGDPVDVYVNDRLVARGEVLVLNDNFCVRVSEIVGEGEVENDQAQPSPVSASSEDEAESGSSAALA